MRRTLAIALSALALAAACGGDAEGGEGSGARRDEEERDGAMDDGHRAEDVAVAVTATAGDRHVAIDFTVTNDGTRPVAVVDPEAGGDRDADLGEGAVRVSYLGPEGRPGGEPPALGEGVLLAPGASHRGTARALTRGGDLPSAVELCVEVVADFDADGDGDGRVTFPYRLADDPPTLACSGRVTVG